MSDDVSVHSSTPSVASPMIDDPEFPPLRRVKPLPKRRRKSKNPSTFPEYTTFPVASEAGPLTTMQDVNATLNAATDELAKALSTTMALSYYMPIFGAAHAGVGQEDVVDSGRIDSSQFNLLSAGFLGDGAVDGDTEARDGDLSGLLQHPGNTKKRKVPVNAQSRISDTNSSCSGEEENAPHRFVSIGRREDAEPEEDAHCTSSHLATLPLAGGRLSRAANAALKHKDLLRARRKQFASVLRVISLGDSLALDQALASHPLVNLAQTVQTQGESPPKTRLSKRTTRRRARLVLMSVNKGIIGASIHASPTSSPLRTKSSSGSDSSGTFTCDFTYECASPTSDRLRAITEEVAVLQAKFEAELKRQAAREAETANQAASLVKQMSKVKREDRAQQRARTAAGNDGGATGNAEQSQVTSGKSPNRKKKRSALANASNPHHLRNYVPSRIPNSGGMHAAQAAINAQNLLGTLPIRFLSAGLPSRRKEAVAVPSVTSMTNLVQPGEEWICAFCEYDLFYGGERGYHQAIRNRKKVLLRRRRALERAAAAASGQRRNANPAETEKGDATNSETEDGDEFEAPESSAVLKPESVLTNVEQDRDRDKTRSNHVMNNHSRQASTIRG